MQRIIEAFLFGLYWLAGGYLLAWFTPWASQVARICAAIGLVLYLVSAIYEETGRRTPFFVGCLLFAPPMTFVTISAIVWAMSFVELL